MGVNAPSLLKAEISEKPSGYRNSAATSTRPGVISSSARWRWDRLIPLRFSKEERPGIVPGRRLASWSG